MNYDDWREVINGPETYDRIGNSLLQQRAAIIGWTDQQATHHDVLFTLWPAQGGSLQGGLNNRRNLLFVSVMRIGAFGFPMTDAEALDPDYVSEKLRVGGPTAAAMAELINGVIAALQTKMDK